MAKLRSVNTKFWDDNYIITLKPIEKLLFLYFLTNPLTDISGAYEISLARISFDTAIPLELLQSILKKFSDEKKVIYREGWIVLPNFIKNQSINPSLKIGIERSLKDKPKFVRKLIGGVQPDTASPQPPPRLSEPNITKDKDKLNAASGRTSFKNENLGAERKKAPASFQAVGEMLKAKNLDKN